MSGRSTIESIGSKVIPADQRKKFVELLDAGDERGAAQQARKWLQDAARTGRISSGEGVGFDEALNIAEANSPPSRVTANT